MSKIAETTISERLGNKCTTWKMGHLGGFLTVLVFIALPLLIIASPVLVYQLRRRERSDPELCPPPSPRALAELRRLEESESPDW